MKPKAELRQNGRAAILVPRPRKQTVRSLEKQIRQCIARIAKQRDILRELISEAAEIVRDCDDAGADFQHGLDTLGQYL